MPSNRSIRNDIFVVALLAAIVFLVAALATYDVADDVSAAPEWMRPMFQPDRLAFPPNLQIRNACGFWGAWVAQLLFQTLGFGAYYVVAGLVTLELSLVRAHASRSAWLRMTGWGLSLIGIATICSYLIPAAFAPAVIGPGGYLGALVQGLLSLQFAFAGGLIIAGSATLIGIMMWTEYLVFRAGRLVFSPAIVAATAMLPFGLIHWMVKRVNGRVKTDERTGESVETDVGNREIEEPRVIRIKKRDATATDLPAQRIVLRGGQTSIEEHDDLELRSFSGRPDDEFDSSETDEADDEFDEDSDAVPDPASSEIGSGQAVPTQSRVPNKPHFTVKREKAAAPSDRDVVISQLNAAATAESTGDYELPNIDLLLKGDDFCFDDQKREALQKAEILERTCQEFGYSVRVVEIETGPVISQYEIQLEAGLRLQKITALADDLAIALRVPSVRIVAPIPGKNTVGVEVPNEARQIVRLREVIEQSEHKTRKMKIPLFLGKDAVGAPMVIDLSTLPHLLIAGRTGTGKSVCLNAIITSILMTRRPDEVRMLMIDPKMVELSGYARLPHLMHPVVTDMRKAEAILAWAVDKMEERYALLARAGVRHISSYNQLGPDELFERLAPESDEDRENIPINLPFIVIVADEMADLMMTSGKEVEQHIIRLAQKSRAVGIHLILATQKPTVDVITGLIKSNLPARIAFQVASKMDSRVVLDAMGAEKLLGNGDMLFLWPGTSTLLRGQGTYLTDDEIESVTESVSTGEQEFVHELIHIKVQKPESETSGGGLPNRDEMYEPAVDVVIREGRGSVSLLQRALGIGYGRAARLIDFMEQDGIVGPYNGSKSREVIMTIAQWQEMQSAGTSELRPAEEIPRLASPPGRVTKLAAAQAAASAQRPQLARIHDEVDQDESLDDDQIESQFHRDDSEDDAADEYDSTDDYDGDSDDADYYDDDPDEDSNDE